MCINHRNQPRVFLRLLVRLELFFLPLMSGIHLEHVGQCILIIHAESLFLIGGVLIQLEFVDHTAQLLVVETQLFVWFSRNELLTHSLAMMLRLHL